MNKLMGRPFCLLFVATVSIWASPLRAQEILTAAGSGDLERVKELISKDPKVLEATNDNLKTAMHFAAQSGHLEMVKFLYERGGPIATPSISGETPLHYAAAGGSGAVMAFLIQKGANVDSRSATGMSPLHYAVLFGKEKAVELLIAKKCQLSSKDEDGNTPLDAAIETKQDSVAELLRSKGARETQVPEPDVAELRKNVYRVSFAYGGKPNICVSGGNGSLLLVDTGYLRTMKKVKTAIGKIEKGQVKYIINTHLHPDHVSGNALGGEHAQIINWDNLEAMAVAGLLRRADGPLKGRSGESFDKYYTMTFNGEEIRLVPAAGAHTGKDIIVHLTKSNVVLMGDLLIPQSFPSVTRAPDRYLHILATVMDVFPRDAVISGGHGRSVSMQELAEYRQMLVSAAAIVTRHLRAGKSIEEIRREDVLAEYDRYNHFIKELNGEYWMNAVYQQYSERSRHPENRRK